MTIKKALLQQSRYIMYLLYIIVLLFHDWQDYIVSLIKIIKELATSSDYKLLLQLIDT